MLSPQYTLDLGAIDFMGAEVSLLLACVVCNMHRLFFIVTSVSAEADAAPFVNVFTFPMLLYLNF